MKTFVTLLAATIVAAATALASTPADAQQKLISRPPTYMRPAIRPSSRSKISARSSRRPPTAV